MPPRGKSSIITLYKYSVSFLELLARVAAQPCESCLPTTLQLYGTLGACGQTCVPWRISCITILVGYTYEISDIPIAWLLWCARERRYTMKRKPAISINIDKIRSIPFVRASVPCASRWAFRVRWSKLDSRYLTEHPPPDTGDLSSLTTGAYESGALTAYRKMTAYIRRSWLVPWRGLCTHGTL